MTGLKRHRGLAGSDEGFGGVSKVGWKQFVSAGLLLYSCRPFVIYSKIYLHHLTNCLTNDEAAPKGGFSDNTR